LTSVDLSTLLPEALPRLWSFAIRICGDRRDAEDLVHRACLRALERSHRMVPDTALIGWLFSIAYSLYNELCRNRVNEHHLGDGWGDDYLKPVADPGQWTHKQNPRHSQIVAAVQRLPESQRLVMLIVAVEGLSYSEAADTLNMPVDRVASLLSQARQTIGALFLAGEKGRFQG
jgi:RNA polymerase sigma-70 factor, ECF subfamily